MAAGLFLHALMEGYYGIFFSVMGSRDEFWTRWSVTTAGWGWNSSQIPESGKIARVFWLLNSQAFASQDTPLSRGMGGNAHLNSRRGTKRVNFGPPKNTGSHIAWAATPSVGLFQGECKVTAEWTREDLPLAKRSRVCNMDSVIPFKRRTAFAFLKSGSFLPLIKVFAHAVNSIPHTKQHRSWTVPSQQSQ